MKKFLAISVLCCFGMLSVTAQGLIQSAMKNDFKTFSKLINKNQSLEETNDKGMNLQIALGYFSDENFNKACFLLNNKGFDFDKPAKNGVTLLYVLAYSLQVDKLKTLLSYNVDVNKNVGDLTPIKATQFSTYKYHSKQTTNPDNYEKAREIQELLLKAGSEEFSYINPPNLYYFGNFLYCNAYAIYQYNKFVNPYQLNEPEYFDVENIENREIDSFKYEILKELYLKYNIDADFVIVRENDEIIKTIQECSNDPNNPYIFMGFTGNNKIAPFQWILLKNSPLKIKNNKINKNDYVSYINSDIFDFINYQLSDFSEMIIIKIKK